MSLSSATGNPRNKVALLPGHSLMDWIRLGNSGADLTSVGGKIQSVTEEELAQHNSSGNAWLVIRGKVYNIQPYLNFHPGGVEELMKGAGKDATALFTNVHPWVNYESILKKCLVGKLVKSKPATQEDFSKAFFDALPPPSTPSPVILPSYKMTWTQTSQFITFKIATQVTSPQVLVRKLAKNIRILVKVRKKVHIFNFEPECDVKCPCECTVISGRVEVKFLKSEEKCWESFGRENSDHGCCSEDNQEFEEYFQARIISVGQVTPNTRTFVLRFDEDVAFWIPIGHDFRVKDMVSGLETSRRYTPCWLPSSATYPTDCFNFLIKYYPDGGLTPCIFEKKCGDVMNIGGIGGEFDFGDLKDVNELYLIAAGTGITPMTRLIYWGLNALNVISTIKLLFLNRTESDIIWRKELDSLSKTKTGFSIEYGLSEPPEGWTGFKGRVDETMLRTFLPSKLPQQSAYVCVCGPNGFSLMIKGILTDWGWGGRSHYFLG